MVSVIVFEAKMKGWESHEVVYLAFSNQTHIASFSWLFLVTPSPRYTHLQYDDTSEHRAGRSEYEIPPGEEKHS